MSTHPVQGLAACGRARFGCGEHPRREQLSPDLRPDPRRVVQGNYLILERMLAERARSARVDLAFPAAPGGHA